MIRTVAFGRTLLVLGACCTASGLFGCGDDKSSSGVAVLTVVSPHNDFIQVEFAEAFRRWHRENYGADVEVRYQQRGGTSEIVRYITSEFEARQAAGTADEGIGIDVFFGGGIPAAERLKSAGCTRAVTVPPDVLEGQPATLAGIPLRDPEHHWYGNVLTAFGIVYNKKALAKENIPEPRTWSDLADEKFYGRVILADPNKSASISVCFEIIFQKHGWPKGWATLMRIGGNTRDFKQRSSQVAPDVAQGIGWAGMCIDFYAHSQIVKSGADVVGYVAPRAATAVTPDPIAVLRGCRDPLLADRFVTFTLTEQGQALWALEPGHPAGPRKHALYRLPAIPSIYEKYGERMMVQARPFTETAGFAYDADKERRRKPIVGPLIAAAFLKNLDGCRRAWRAVIDSGMDPALVAEFEAPPFTEDESLALGQAHRDDSRRALQLDRQWFRFFRDKYERILSRAGN